MEKPKCEYCNRHLVISAIDEDKNIAYLSCPDYMAGNDEHACHMVELSRELEELLENERPVLYW